MNDELKQRVTKALEWMIEDMKWRHNETKMNEAGLEDDYSPELLDAIDVLEELKGKT